MVAMTSIEDHHVAGRAPDGVPVGAVVCGLPVSEAAPGVDPFVLLAQAHEAVTELQAADLSMLEDDWLTRYAKSADELLARVDSVNIDVAGHVRHRGHGREMGFFSTKSWLKHHVRLSGREAHRRMQVLRMFELLPGWARAARAGEVGVGQTRLMARVAANPRVHIALMDEWERLLDEACVLEYDAFERRLRDFERLADPAGAASSAESREGRRDARMGQRRDGSWWLSASFGSLTGAEMNEVFAHFVWAEWESDWADARDRAGDDATVADLARTEPHRRADALKAIFLAAARAPGEGRGPLPTLNVLIDEATLDDVVNGRTVPVERFRDMVCRTQNGDPVDLSEAAAMALWANIRRVVHDSSGVVIDLGRRERLFRGAARDAVMLLGDRCLWPGCDRRVRHCEADHSLGWRAHGNSVPRNGGPMCRAHNLIKERHRFSARRADDGTWIITDADGNVIA